MKRLNLIEQYEKYKSSDFQKINRLNIVPALFTIDGVDCFFYNPDLYGLITWNYEDDGIKPIDFASSYKDGFIQGLEHLENEEGITIRNFQSKDLKENTINQLRKILYAREFKTGYKGLLSVVFRLLPLIFNEKNMFQYGYWNGIIYSVDRLADKVELEFHQPGTKERLRPSGKLEYLTDKELKNVFKAIEIENFRNLNKRLHDRGYLNDNREWRGNAPELVALILVLKEAQWFKKSIIDIDIRKFFMELYQINIVQQFKPSRRENAKKHKSIFEGMLP